MAKLPKVKESSPRIVVITHGKEPSIVVKGTFKYVITGSNWASSFKSYEKVYVQDMYIYTLNRMKSPTLCWVDGG